jgi:SNF2 family DNA or RNA helicase
MIAKDTIEDKVLAIQAQKNELIQQAFAGNKIKETVKRARYHR